MSKPVRVALTALVAMLVAVGLTACGPDHGIVHDKQHSDAFWFTSCSLVGKATICSLHYVPPSWSLDVYASKDDHGWVDVSESTYEHERVGDYVDLRSH